MERQVQDFDQKEKAFMEVAENLPEFFWIASPDGKILWLSKSFSDFLGMCSTDINSGGWKKITSKSKQFELLENYKNCLKTRKSWRETFYLKGRDKKWHCFMVNATPFSNGSDRVRCWIGTNIDITHLKETEEQLKKSDTRYKCAVRATQDVIYDWDLKTNIIVWNDALRTKLLHKKYPPRTRIKWWQDNIHPFERDSVSENLLSAIENKQSEWTMSYRFKKGDGNYANILERGRILFDESGAPLRMIGAMTDVTAEYHAVSRLRNAKLIAEKANEAKSKFLASMSHEMRTPLSAIMGFVELMLREETDDETRKEFLCVIKRNGEHLLRIMEDVLDLSKIQAGKMSIKKERVDTSNLLKEVCDLFKRSAGKKNINFRTEISANVPSFVYSDNGRLKQIILNMVGNAIKFTEKGHVRLRLNYSAPQLIIQVDDSGIGIAKEKQEYIFEPFTQADSNIHNKYGGTGLGLSLTKQICEALGGKFRLVKSSPGSGSCFEATVFSPLCKNTEKPDEVKVEEKVNFHGLKILVVDDIKDNLILVDEYLRPTKAMVHLASSGEEALWLVSENVYDVILLDIRMPKMSGFEVNLKLKSLGITSPVIALTANAMKFENDKMKKAGFDRCITKPIDPSVLYDSIKALDIKSKRTRNEKDRGASFDAPLH